MSGPGLRRPDADARAAQRFALAGGLLLAVAVVVGLLGALVETQWGPLRDLDDATTREAERLGSLVGPAELLTHLGDPLFVSVASLVLALVLWRTGHGRLALLVVVSRVGAAVLSSSIKAVADRARPVFDEPVASAYGSSFPSGHTLGGAAFWLTVAVVLLSLRGWRWTLPVAVALALVIAATRVVLGVHYLSDVVAGLVLAAGWVAACTTLFSAWSSEEGHADLEGDGLT